MKYAFAVLGIGFIFIIGFMSIGMDNQKDMSATQETAFTLTSSVFVDGETIPQKYSCDGDNVNPPLSISGVPEGTQSLVLVMDDPDIPQVFKDERGIDSFDHWVVYAIDPTTSEIEEGKVFGAHGVNGRGAETYTGPCPPPEYEPTTHRYIFTLYALSGTLNFITTPTKADVLTAIEAMIIEKTQLIGVYDRSH